MKEYTLGDHGSVFHGSGVDFVGLRDWQAGDRMSSIDWAQSSLTNFSPMVIREYEQPGTAPIVVVADQSPSTRCGTAGTPIAAGIARATATIGLSAVYFQDMFGLITFDHGFANMAAIRPRVGRGHVIHCLDAYQGRVGLEEVKTGGRLATTIAGHLRRTALVPVISDFLFEDAGEAIRELARAELGSRRVSGDDRQRVRVRAAGCVGRLGERVRHRNRGVTADVAARAARARSAGTGLAGRPRAAGARRRPGCAADRRQPGGEPPRVARIRDGTGGCGRHEQTRPQRERPQRIRRVCEDDFCVCSASSAHSVAVPGVAAPRPPSRSTPAATPPTRRDRRGAD